jgi:hypothetical protein
MLRKPCNCNGGHTNVDHLGSGVYQCYYCKAFWDSTPIIPWKNEFIRSQYEEETTQTIQEVPRTVYSTDWPPSEDE